MESKRIQNINITSLYVYRRSKHLAKRLWQSIMGEEVQNQYGHIYFVRIWKILLNSEDFKVESPR